MPQHLFSPFDLRGVKLPNRVVMAPMTRARALKEIPDDLTVRYYAQRASAGLIVSEGAPVSREGTGYLFTPGLYTPEQVAGWQRVTEAVRGRGGRIFAQLWHAGRASHVSLQAEGRAPVSSVAKASGDMAFGYRPDGTPGRIPASTPRALRTDEVARVAADFAAAAANAERADFHGVELHAATQYLFEQFLNSRLNDRADRYGGRSVADRIRFTLEVTDAVAGQIGASRVGIRISPFSTVGNMPADDRTEETYRALADELAARGLAYVHVHDTSGFADDEGSLRQRLHRLLRDMRVRMPQTPLVLAGGMTPESAEELIGDDVIDLAAFGQLYISNPDLVGRLRTGTPLTPPDRTTYFGGDAAGYTDYPAATPCDA